MDYRSHLILASVLTRLSRTKHSAYNSVYCSLYLIGLFGIGPVQLGNQLLRLS